MRRRLLRIAVVAAAAGCAASVLTAVVLWFAIGWTEEDCSGYAGGIVLRDAAGSVLRVSLGPGDVDCRPYYTADRDDWIVKALVAAEDGTFWTHRGVRPLSILRAFCQNVFYRRRISGASTITMQAVRLIAPHRKSYAAKLAEAVRALKMERAKDKVWIISQYLNRAPFGSNFVGVEAAANGWFGKSAKELGLGEAALLAGMVQAPSRFRPDRGYGLAIRRRDYVLGRMRELGMITAEQLQGARSVFPAVCRAPRPFRSPYFCDYALATLGRDRSAQRRSGDFVTTLDADIQSLCETSVNAAAAAGGYASAAVVMKVATGEVAALAVSGDYFDPTDGQVNTALAPRPAGSTLKPFLAALAMDRGLATPEERLADEPVSYEGYRPANFDGRCRGRVTLADALVLSLNLPFVGLLERTGIGAFGDTLRSLGFAHLGVEDRDAGLGMAIGNVETTLVELVAAYGALARGGVFRRPVAVKGGAPEPGTRICSEEAAYLVSEILSGTERSAAAFGHVADAALPRFAWKTGTSSAYRDAWTVLWNPEYVVGVWCGHLAGGFGDRTVVGAKAAAPVAWEIARALCPRGEGPWFAEPGGVARRRICRLTGLPANPDCPGTEEGRYLRGRSSTRLCGVHGRDAEGRPVLRPDAAALPLRILKPAPNAVFTRVTGVGSEQLVCTAAGAAPGERIWWFCDSVPVGVSSDGVPLAIPLAAGRHDLTCTTADGRTASVAFEVR